MDKTNWKENKTHNMTERSKRFKFKTKLPDDMSYMLLNNN